ncbi:MAG TPA: hypothetical protein VF188_00180 [Longimicrobiales bacterium]
MFGRDPFGVRPFGTRSGPVPPIPASITLLTAARIDAVYLVEIFGVDIATGEPRDIFLADRPYVTRPDETPANRVYWPRLETAPYFERIIPITPEEGVRARLGLGEIIIANGDGFFDSFVEEVAIGGRRVVVKLGTPASPLSEFVTLFDGTAVGWSQGNDATIRVELRDIGALLERPLQQRLYAGTGGLEGGPRLEGKPKPLCYGHVPNVTAVLVDPARQIYQVHDGLLWRIPAVYDAGLPLANGGNVANIESAEPAPGFYITSHLQGMFRLGSSPAGLVTADVEGDAAQNIFAETTADIVRRILTTRAGFDVPIDAATLIALNTAQPARVGLSIGLEVRTLAGVLDDLLGGIAGWWGPNRLGQIQVGRLDAPSGTGQVTLTADDILDLELLPLPESINPPNWRRRVAWGINWTVQTEGLAAAVDDERRAYLAEPFRVAPDFDESIKQIYPGATDPAPTPGLFRDAGAAKGEAARLRELFGVPRRRFRVVCKLKPALVEPGQMVALDDHRYGLAGGVLGAVTGHRIDCDRNQVTLEVLV